MKWVINSFRRDRLLNESLKSLDLRTDSVRHLDVCGSEVQQGMMKLSGDDGELLASNADHVIEESHVDKEASLPSLDLRTDSIRHLDVPPPCGSEVQQGMMKLSGDDGELASKSTGAGFLLNTEGDDNGYVIEESHVDDEVSFRDDVMKLVSCDFELSKSVEKLAI
jgi:hypothetical protein